MTHIVGGIKTKRELRARLAGQDVDRTRVQHHAADAYFTNPSYGLIADQWQGWASDMYKGQRLMVTNDKRSWFARVTALGGNEFDVK